MQRTKNKSSRLGEVKILTNYILDHCSCAIAHCEEHADVKIDLLQIMHFANNLIQVCDNAKEHN